MRGQASNFPFIIGFLVSLCLHLVGGFALLISLEAAAARAARAPEIFSVTLEGGESLGGFNQVPKEDQKQKNKAKSLPKTDSDPKTDPETTKQPVEPAKTPEPVKTPEPKVEKNDVIKDPIKDLMAVETLEKEKKLREADEKKAEEKKLEEKKKLEDKKKKEELDKEKKAQELEDKKKLDEDRKKETQRARDEEKKKAENDKKKRDKALKDAIARVGNSDYTGESVDAGGSGIGAARLGGKGTGGGILASAEFVGYRNQLVAHIKSEWRWLKSDQVLEAIVTVRVMPDGKIEKVTLARSSGNAKFDESIVRAVLKSSPVPAAPERLYSSFQELNITFNSQD